MIIAIGQDGTGQIEFLNTGYLTHGHFEPEAGEYPAELSIRLDTGDINELPKTQELIYHGEEARAVLCGLIQAAAITVNLERIKQKTSERG